MSKYIGIRQYPDIEKRLREYRSADKKINKLRAKIREQDEKRKAINELKATRLSGMPSANQSHDPVLDFYIIELENIDEEILRLNMQIKEIERERRYIDIKMEELEDTARLIIEWKYFEECPTKLILWRLKKELGYQVGQTTFYEMLSNIYPLLK